MMEFGLFYALLRITIVVFIYMCIYIFTRIFNFNIISLPSSFFYNRSSIIIIPSTIHL